MKMLGNILRTGCWLLVFGLVAAWLTVAAPVAQAGMQLLNREMFVPMEDLTSEAPGENFAEVAGTLLGRPGGPHLAGQPPASADLRGAGLPAAGWFELSSEPSAALGKVFVGGWFFVKDVQGPWVDLLSVCDVFGNMAPAISMEEGKLVGGIRYHSAVASGLECKNRWIYLGIALRMKSGTQADVRFYAKFPGQPLQCWLELADVNVGITGAGKMLVGGWTFGSVFKGRLGAPSAYVFENDDFSDVEYPAEVQEPVNRMTWYCDPLNGDDAADGTSPETAWKSAGKINLESSNAGMFSAGSPEEGDVLVINTAGAPLDLSGRALVFSTDGLHVRAAAGQEWVEVKSYRSLPGAVWQPTATPHVFATSDTQADVVLWEDDRFLHHPVGTGFPAVAAQLSSTPGSFWTDGSTLYVHPFGSTDPRTDGKRYERSYRFAEGGAVLLNAANLTVEDIRAGKTTLAGKLDNDPIGGHCLVLTHSSGFTVIRHCFLYYGSKHNLGLVQGQAGDVVLVEDVQCEQGSPYASAGGQTLFVSFSHVPEELNIRHRFVRCRSVANAGLIGSAEGIMTQAYPVFYAHNMEQPGEPQQFARFEFVDCDFGIGNIQGGAVKQVHVEGTRCGSLSLASEVTAERCFFRGMNMVAEGWSVTERNCVHELKGQLQRNLVAGRLDIQNCTVDARQVGEVQGGVFDASLFNRAGALSLVFKNNLVLMPEDVPLANVFSHMRSTDVLEMDRNGYQLGSSTLFCLYDAGAGSEPVNLDFGQWQGRGQDLRSLSAAGAWALNGLKPVPGSPLIDAGFDLGPAEDFSGRVFRRRDDMGAWESPPVTYEGWMAENFTEEELEDPVVSAPGTDYLADGQANLLKYALGKAPGSPAGPPVEVSVMPAPEAEPSKLLSVSYCRSLWPSDLEFELKVSCDLREWQAAEIVDEQVLEVEGDRALVRVTVRSPFLKICFLRLEISQVSPPQ